MQVIRYKPKTDKLFWILFIPINILCLSLAVFAALDYVKTLLFTLPVLIFVNYFFISPLFGYVELRENELFIKYGFFLRKSIEYKKIRALKKERRFYSESMMSLKNSFDHINIRYNSFDVTCVSVEENDGFLSELRSRMVSN